MDETTMDAATDVRTRRHREQTAQSAQTFACHLVVDRAPGRWTLRAPADARSVGMGPVEVVALRWGHLLVYGDCDHVVFARCGLRRDGTPEEHARAMVGWMGDRAEVCAYVREKASIGMEGNGVDVFDVDCFIDDVRRWLADPETGWAPRLREVLWEAIEHAACGDAPATLGERLQRTGDFDAEELCRLGMVVAPAVYTAHAAVRRLWTLLQAESDATG